MKALLTLVAVSAFCLLQSSCGSYYTQPPKSDPHAIADFQQGSGFLNLKGVNFVIVSLNGKRPENWVPGNNTEERYRIPVGQNEIATYIYGDESYLRGEDVIVFSASNGVTYDITAEDRPAEFLVKVAPRGGNAIYSRTVPKKGYRAAPVPIYVPIPIR